MIEVARELVHRVAHMEQVRNGPGTEYHRRQVTSAKGLLRAVLEEDGKGWQEVSRIVDKFGRRMEYVGTGF